MFAIAPRQQKPIQMIKTPFFSLSILLTLVLGSSSSVTTNKRISLRSPGNKILNFFDVGIENSQFWQRNLRRGSSSSSYTYGGAVSISASTDARKTQWPECVNNKMTCDECRILIEKEGPSNGITNVEILGLTDPATLDLRDDRVRITCNKATNAVTMVPYIG